MAFAEAGSLGICNGTAFSADGTLLAGCFQGLGGKGRILAIDVVQGKIVADHSFPQPLNLMVPNAFASSSPALQWVPDNSGWLAYGDTIIDRQSGAAGFSIGSLVKSTFHGPRRMAT